MMVVRGEKKIMEQSFYFKFQLKIVFLILEVNEVSIYNCIHSIST